MPLSAAQKAALLGILTELQADETKLTAGITAPKNKVLQAKVVTDTAALATLINELVPDTVTPPPNPLAFSPPSQESLVVGTPFSLTLSASGGTPPYSFTSQGLPGGLSLSGGVISGTPSVAGSFTTSVTCSAVGSTPVVAKIVFTVANTIPPPPPPPPPGQPTRNNMVTIGQTLVIKALTGVTNATATSTADGSVMPGAIANGLVEWAGLPGGHYRLKQFNGTTVLGSTMGWVAIAAPHLPPPAAPGTPGTPIDPIFLGLDTLARTQAGMGFERWSVEPRTLVHSGGNDMSVADILTLVKHDIANWGAVSDPARPRTTLVAMPTGPFDVAKLTANGGADWDFHIASINVDPSTTWVEIPATGLNGATITATSFPVNVYSGTTATSTTLVEQFVITQVFGTNEYLGSAATGGVSKYVRAFGFPNNWVTFLAPVKPTMLAEVSGVDLHQNISTMCGELAQAGCFHLEGPWNEPDETGEVPPNYQIGNSQEVVWAANLQKAAALRGDSRMIYTGPGAVSDISVQDQSKVSGLQEMLAWATSPGGPGDPFMAKSKHDYNGTLGDPWLMDQSMANFKSRIALGTPTTDLWQTEQGTAAADYGVLHSYRQARWDILRYLNREAHGIPYEKEYYFEDTVHGYWSQPEFWLNWDGSVMAGAVVQRVLSTALYGKNFAMEINLGNAGPYAKAYRFNEGASSGQGDVVAILNAGGPALTAKVTLGAAATVMDAWGNPLPSLSAGQVTFPVNGLPTYLFVPKGTTLTITDLDGLMTAPLVSGGIDSTSGSSTNIGQIQAGPASSYLYGNGLGGTDSPWFDSSGAVPCSVTRTFPSTQEIGGVAWQCGGPPWQGLSGPGAFEVDALINGTWVSQFTYSNPSMVSTPFNDGPANGGNGTGTVLETYWDEAWSFHCPFKAKVSATAIRITATSLSHGGEPDAASATNLGQGSKPMFSVRGILVHG